LVPARPVAAYKMAEDGPRATHFAEDPPHIINQTDLNRANEKLREQEAETNNEKSDNFGNGNGNSSDDHASSPDDTNRQSGNLEKLGTYDKYEITEDDCYEELGYSFSNSKKWYILTVIFWVQVSMNFNTSLYSNAIGGISEEFGVSLQAARAGAMIFLVLYAFGCELWAPWSEECLAASRRTCQ